MMDRQMDSQCHRPIMTGATKILGCPQSQADMLEVIKFSVFLDFLKNFFLDILGGVRGSRLYIFFSQKVPKLRKLVKRGGKLKNFDQLRKQKILVLHPRYQIRKKIWGLLLAHFLVESNGILSQLSEMVQHLYLH